MTPTDDDVREAFSMLVASAAEGMAQHFYKHEMPDLPHDNWHSFICSWFPVTVQYLADEQRRLHSLSTGFTS